MVWYNGIYLTLGKTTMFDYLVWSVAVIMGIIMITATIVMWHHEEQEGYRDNDEYPHEED